ncbi:sensor histidine kinase [Desulfovibrio inopinatus]|uniref:sensor histidine kinase n=1 Tax=Desulfovibrio inopinatus TaxID=102109 RepID=UPI00040D0318|nr:HAMP domain-containing sensor histidine kinase [Desulfovibrio inopinatus]
MVEKNLTDEFTLDTIRPNDVPNPLSPFGKLRLMSVQKRIHEKIDDYTEYNFNPEQSSALNIFFDLAQEFNDVEDLYAICVMIPKILFSLDATLYILQSEGDVVVRSTLQESPVATPDLCELPLPVQPKHVDGRYIIPIKGNHELISLLPFDCQGDIIGVLEIYPTKTLCEHDRLFWERYANRIGYQLHNRIIGQKNREHIQFIRTLVKDIGHNVIVPNMYFKLFYRRLDARINLIDEFAQKLDGVLERCEAQGALDRERRQELTDEMGYIYKGLRDQYKQIYNHYKNTSLFLETLLRRSHFEKGRYVLEKRACNFKSQIIDPQLERFRPRLAERQVEIDTSLGGVPDEEIEVVADIGLISQVYSNLFSNAVKYAREVDDRGRLRKFLSYGWDVMKNYFGPGRDGVKLNVFSSGPPLSKEESSNLFDEGFRGVNAKGEYGTGHGLYFIREVVRLHGGVCGYEPTPQGNNFYFILPRDLGPESDACDLRTA